MKPVFLATTSLEEFWDKTQPIVFLGEWCQRHSRKSVWQTLGGQMVANPWANGRKTGADQHYLETLYERLMSHLGQSLNALHGLHVSNRYWRILLGSWLWEYVAALHDYSVLLEAAKRQYPGFSTILLDEDSYFVPRNTMEFNWVCSEDAYNLQLISKILSFGGGDFLRKPMQVQVTYPGVNNPAALERRPWKEICKRLVRWIERATRGFSRVVLTNSYFSNAAQLKLFLRTRGAVWPHFLEESDYPDFTIQQEVRRSLLSDFQATSEFERMMIQVLPSDIPQTFVEGFNHLRGMYDKRYPGKPKAIFSANAWHYYDDFKQWAASHAEKGVPLLGTQHGGNYGSLLNHPCEKLEIGIVDQFYSWGWNGIDRVKPFVSTKLSTQKTIRRNPRETAVLYGATCNLRYLFLRNTMGVANLTEYFAWQSRFFQTLPPSLRDVVRLRPHCVDYGWDVAERWHDMIPGASVESWDTPFSKSLEKCRIYVCDNLSTTFIESLVSDKPTILFWDTQSNPLRPEAQPFYDALGSVGIMHDSPEAAAAHLTRVYDDVSSWWDAPGCQKVRREFCHQFARTSPKAIREWARELGKMA